MSEGEHKKNDISLNVCNLWESKSQSGNIYLKGELGRLKVLIFKKHKREKDGDPTHYMKFAPAINRNKKVKIPDPNEEPRRENYNQEDPPF